MVAGNGQDFSRIATVWAIETFSIMIFFVGAVHDIAKMKQKCRIESSGTRMKIRGHLFCDFLSFLGMVDSGVADRVEADFPQVLNFLDTIIADDVAEIHTLIAARRKDWAQVFFTPVDHSLMTVE